MKTKLMAAVLLGMLIGQNLVGLAAAGSPALITFSDVQRIIRVLERIEANTRR
jgi:hypothetical protein